MRIMALDIGQVRVGIAISDAEERLATPVCVLTAQEVLGATVAFRRVLQDWEPGLLVCGMPYTLSGEEGRQAAYIRKVASHLSSVFDLPVQFCDERLSSREAKRILREEGLSERDMRGKIDMVAASLFLQTWLDARRSAER